ncbi:phosphohistidine phosphatase SixA [Meiothermus taiwanensis]|jgi:phosphohistidine phosphatase|uniref:Phosphohistidine phosphatase SixA n=2 Tax=Meiothermus taiwanensis TaxID=172827 RepID=A0A399E1M3_9DEIN|nr:phosphohistidine phosphatase SixA [Meiothermus taiwanensis]AWR86961.1 phosphohistidine phosphatase, SixA [Meiothermus taiwanensis WR-220]KIQ54868.1 phosphohistidine phosphatase [Meiothermus taiwanensis]KZK16957.1 phosphohistidine phosphatase [Meiothermus taiwanensis]RIH76430.1 phosphohistidine phosphatase SixA [Meiothermus taiwanensis]
MELYLIRHAIALEAAPGQSDDARPLSPEGIQKFSEVVRGLKRLGVRLDRLYHSPKLRAVQTAELLVPLLEGETEVTPYLAAEPSLALLETLQGSSVALVGHEPWMGELCAWLLTTRREGHTFPFKKGGVALLEGPPKPGQMKLLGFWAPRLLRRLGQ